MPVAVFPALGGGGGPGTGPNLAVILPTVPLDPAPPTPIVKGHVVAVADLAGTASIVLCGALAADHPDLCFGIMDIPVLGGGSTVITGRGSLFAPIVQGAVPLVPDVEIFLSTTPGEVTQTAPAGAGQTILRLGYAISTTQAILTTDFRQEIP